VAELARRVRPETGELVEVAFAGQGYAGQQPAAEHGIRLGATTYRMTEADRRRGQGHSMILVTGVTGQFGRIALEFLHRKLGVARIAALARDVGRARRLLPPGVDVRHGDYSDYPSLVRAFAGIEKLLFVSSSAPEGVAEQHENVVRAAAEAGIKHIVYTSIVNVAAPSRVRLINEYKATEDALKASSLTYTILRNGYYLDMLPMFIGDAPQTGRLRYPAGDGRASYAARADLAEAAANLLVGDGHERRVYVLNANASHSFHDIAAALSEVTGRHVSYVDIPLEVMAQELRGQMSPPEVELMLGIATSIKHGEADCPTAELEALLGRTPIGLKEFLTNAYAAPAA
jgi:NAD(P)H dehydrogenase (quinone)